MAIAPVPGIDTSAHEAVVPRVTLVPDHPLLRHHMTVLRAKSTGVVCRRASAKFVSGLVIMEATRTIKSAERPIWTPLAKFEGSEISQHVEVVEIWRAGKWMTQPVVDLFPTAGVSCIGTRRNEESAEPENYYCNISPKVGHSFVLMVDPMLATGGSMIDAIKRVIKAGATEDNVKAVVLIAAPEGVLAVNKAFPDVAIFAAALDERLNEKKYIVPGLGDAGDLLSGS